MEMRKFTIILFIFFISITTYCGFLLNIKENKIRSYELKIYSMSEDLNKQKSMNKELSDKVDALNVKIERVEKEKEALEKEKDHLENENKKLLKEKDNLLELLQKAKSDFDNYVKKVESKIKDVEQKFSLYRKEVEKTIGN